jgi:hypothetical protein
LVIASSIICFLGQKFMFMYHHWKMSLVFCNFTKYFWIFGIQQFAKPQTPECFWPSDNLQFANYWISKISVPRNTNKWSKTRKSTNRRYCLKYHTNWSASNVTPMSI